MEEPVYAKNLAKGDLCIYSGYSNILYPGVFKGLGKGTFQFYRLTEWTVKAFKEGSSPVIDYIGGSRPERRLAKLDPSCLSQEEQDIYNQIKEILCR